MKYLALLWLLACPAFAKPCGPMIQGMLKVGEQIQRVKVFNLHKVGHFFTTYVVEPGNLSIIKVPITRYSLFTSSLRRTGLVFTRKRSCKQDNKTYLIIRVQSEVRV